MATTEQAIQAIVTQGMLPLYFHADPEVSKEILRAVYKAGVKAIEYTSRGDAALQNFSQLVALRDAEMPGLLLGIGTIKNLPQAKDYLAVGADFLVSPGYVAEIATYAVANDLLYAPGCMTPTEIIAAETAGIKFIKLFPGDTLGARYLAAIKPVFPRLLFMPTGGVDTTRENIESWFKAGVCAVGMGSKLISKDLMAAGDYEGITTKAKEVFDTIQSVKAQ